MSSIYRKGRDGYFYYQTYIKNPKTGKKDKRIFHSLSTKNYDEAKLKKVEYDKKYEQKGNSFDSLYKFIFSNFYKITFSIILILIYQYLSNSNELAEVALDNEEQKLIKPNFEDETLKISNEEGHEKDNHEILELVKIEQKGVPTVINEDSLPLAMADNILENHGEDKNENISKYKVHRVEKVSGAFEQGKIYLTVSKDQDLLSICEKVTSEYSQFINIVICVYLESTIGVKIAKGEKNGLSKKEQMDTWLAMYTYNSVEGPYFDDNPGGYLGAF